MITHYIILSSSYSTGKRIAIDYAIDKKEKLYKLKNLVNKITEECGNDVSISTHFIQADSEEWKSVVEKDYFFKDVKLLDSIQEFINLIKKDRVLNGLDVAKYILSKIRCTHLKLQKLVYLCFADYLCKYDKELYQDKIYAFRYGPVIETVYQRYKGSKDREIEKDDDIDATNIFEMPSRSRIIFAEDGVNKINSIDDTLAKYGDYTAKELVDITHRKNTPWDITTGNQIEEYKIIENDIIKKYHCNESI